MRILMISAALVAIGGCSRGGNNGSANAAAGNNAAAPAPTNSANAAAPAANMAAPVTMAAAGGLPQGFPDADPTVKAVECHVFLGLSRQAGTRPAGRDDTIMEQAQGQWRAALTTTSRLSEQEVQQLIGSSVNPMSAVPAELRDAASAWCVENAPEVDPEG